MEKIAFAQEENEGDAELVRAWEQGEATPIAEGISRAFWLHRPAYEVGFWVQNVGTVYGGEVSFQSMCRSFSHSYFLKLCVRSHNCTLPSLALLVNLLLSFVGLRIRR